MFRHAAGIGPKISATYLAGLERYVLITEVGGSETGQIAFHESTSPSGPWRTMLRTKFPGTTFMATILPQSVRGDRLTLGFTGTGPHDALNLVDARILRKP